MSTVGEGDTGTYTVVLESEPSGDVTVTARSADVLAVTVSPMVLTFTTGDWATAQTVTVRAEHDTDADDEEVDVLHTAASSVDTVYNNLAVETVTVTVTDDDANAAPTFDVNVASREVAENTVSGALGDPITATDEDVGDTLMYSVAATTDTDATDNLMDFDRDFAVDSESGQISVNAEAMIDFEDRSTYTVLFQVSDGNDASSMPDMTADATLTLTVTVTDVDEPGTVSFGADPDVGTALTASVTDPEVVSGTPTWQWAKSRQPDTGFTNIIGATGASYTPVEADRAHFLRATATYTDGAGSNKTASAVTRLPVSVTAVTLVETSGSTEFDRQPQNVRLVFRTGGQSFWLRVVPHRFGDEVR